MLKIIKSKDLIDHLIQSIHVIDRRTAPQRGVVPPRGHIEVNYRDGTELGSLSQSSLFLSVQ